MGDSADFEIDLGDFEPEPPQIHHAVRISNVRNAGVTGLGIVFGDRHAPYEADLFALGAVLDAIRKIKPDWILDGGDGVEASAFSEYPADSARRSIEQGEEEFRLARKHEFAIREAAGDRCKIIRFGGNHEHRVPRWLHRHAPRLMASFDLPTLLGLKETGALWVPEHEQPMLFGTALALHGHQFLKSEHTVAHAEAFLRKYGCSGFYFHTHKPRVAYLRTWSRGQEKSTGMGCVRTLRPNFTGGPAAEDGWAHGFGVVSIPKVGRTQVDEVGIFEGRASYGGQEFSGLVEK